MRKLSQREYEARLAWINKDLENPSKSDQYLMMIAAEVRRGRYTDPSLVNLEDMKLTFTSPSDRQLEKEKKKPKENIAVTKSRWCGLLGIRGK